MDNDQLVALINRVQAACEAENNARDDRMGRFLKVAWQAHRSLREGRLADASFNLADAFKADALLVRQGEGVFRPIASESLMAFYRETDEALAALSDVILLADGRSDEGLENLKVHLVETRRQFSAEIEKLMKGGQQVLSIIDEASQRAADLLEDVLNG